ncbi:MAG: methylated-DNA-[protein]-cysteine S-methyltransferase, partial [Paracoccaceae bacterium]
QLKMFDVEMSFPSSAFQHGVLESMMSIPFGSTKTYGEIADYVEGSAQAVGNACGANPIPILIPCHRVLGANSLGGFSGSGGVESKVFLLRLEGAAGLLI